MNTHTAKVFKNGRSQAIRIPAAFRLDAEEVFIRKNEFGEIVLTPKAQSFFDLLCSFDCPDIADTEIEIAPRTVSTRPAIEF